MGWIPILMQIQQLFVFMFYFIESYGLSIIFYYCAYFNQAYSLYNFKLNKQ